jgi:predicted  nucleic acid-binding Zn-ribbon protein
MKNKLTLRSLFLLAFISIFELQAQQTIGLQMGNHNASYAYSLNPAQTYSSKNRFYFNFWGAGVGFTNNFLTYSAPFSLWQLGAGNIPDRYKNNAGKPDFDPSWLALNPNTNNWKLYYLDETYGPSMHFRITRRTAIGIGIKSVAGMSITGVDKNLGNLFRFGLDSSGQGFSGPNGIQVGKNYELSRFSINTDKWQEWFFSVAGVTRDKGRHFTKWGATGKILLGMGAGHLGVNGGSYRFNNFNQVELNDLQTTWFHTNDQSATRTLTSPFGMKFDFLEGAGLGADLGFMYENRPKQSRKRFSNPWFNCLDEDDNAYKWRFGASLTDLGFIVYGGQSRMINNKDVSTTWNVNRNLVNTYRGFGQDPLNSVSTGFYDSLNADAANNFVTTTPTALNVQFDRRYRGDLYLGINWTHSLKGDYAWGVRRASFLSVVPRWETEHAEVGVPLTLTRDYTDFNLGVYGRLGPFTLGTDNIGGIVKYASKGSYTGANVYFGIRMKLEACGWLYYKSKEYKDSVQNTRKAVQNNDTFWKRDTITVIKRDTIQKTEVIRKTDTVVKYRNLEVSPDLKKKEEELRKKEADLKAKEEDLRKRELEINAKATNCKPCQDELVVVKQQLATTRDQLSRLRIQLDECNRNRVVVATENDDLKKRNAILLAEVDKLKRENAVLKLNSNPCDKQVKSRDSLLAVEREKNVRLQAELDKKKLDCDGVQKELDNTRKRVAVLEAEVADGKKKVAALETELSNCRLGSAGTNADCLNKIKQLEAQITAEKLKTTALQKELTDTKAKLDAEIKKNAALLLDLEACRKATADDKKRIAELEALLKNSGDCNSFKLKIAELEEKLKNCANADELNKCKADLDIAKKRNAELEAEVLNLKANQDKQSKLIAELEAKLKNCGNTEELNKCKADLDAAKKRNAELEAELVNVKKQRDQYLSELDANKKKVSELEVKLKECEGKGTDCKECDEALAQLKIQYEQKESAYNALMEEYKACAKDLSALKTKLSDCEAKLKNCSGSSSKEKELQAEIDKLKRTIAELNAEVAARQKSLDELQAAYDKLESNNAELGKKITAMQSELNALKTQVGLLQQQLKECQESGK